MNFLLTDIPNREKKPRESGLTMVMDKGMSVKEVRNFIESSKDYTDIVKLGFGTSAISPNVEKKIEMYHNSEIKVHLGGTLFEAFIIRGMYEDYKKLMRNWNIKMCEVSDGSIKIDHKEKCKYITDLSREFTVVSEIGMKNEDTNLTTEDWINLMKKELEAGSWKVITEAREGGNIGMFNNEGEIKSDLVNKILKHIPSDKILWETPQKNQQVWFVNLLGHNVNLGNISANEVIPLETLRLGLRGDTFFNYLSSKV